MKSQKVIIISLLVVAVLLVAGMTGCTRAKPIRPSVAEAPTSVPGAGVTMPTPEIVFSEVGPTAEVVSEITPPVLELPTTALFPAGEAVEVTPLILEPSPTAVPGMPTPTTEGRLLPVEQLTPVVTLIIPLTPEVELPPTSTPVPQTADGRPGQKYIVQENDTLFSISVRFGTSIEEIKVANNLQDDWLSVGQELIIPVPPPPVEEPVPSLEIAPTPAAKPLIVPEQGAAPALEPGNIYVVQAGDNLFRIALRFGVSMDAIAEANNIVPPWYVIYTGQRLVIPQ